MTSTNSHMTAEDGTDLSKLTYEERQRRYVRLYLKENGRLIEERAQAIKAAKKRLGRHALPSDVISKDWPNGKGPSERKVIKE